MNKQGRDRSDLRRAAGRGPVALLSVMALLFSVACTDTSLYSPNSPRKQADRLALTGRVCSEDPVEARFPVRLVMLVDQAAGPLYSDFDPGDERVGVMREFVQAALANPETEIAFVGYGGRPQKLAPVEGEFTRNPGELLNAVSQMALAQPCVDDSLCRDYREAIRTARTLIEGDIASMPEGLRVLTQYVVIMVNAGHQQPRALGSECCAPDDVDCRDAGQMPTLACEIQKGSELVASLRETVADSGAAGLRFHTLHLAAESRMTDNDAVQSALSQMAFAGGGTYQRYDSIGGFELRALDLLGLRTVLRAKLLLAANLNVRPGPNGPLIDSDADGLTDQEELALGTNPSSPDTDADGVSDRVEVFGGFDPLMPEIPKPCLDFNIGQDTDLDGLTDCDEALLGTEPSLVDSDGDGMPDRLEVFFQTDYLSKDAESDSDGDGVSNGDEIMLHADPRSTDLRAHLSSGYRYEIDDQGVTRELFASTPVRATGVEIIELSDGTTPGLGVLSYRAGDGRLLWQDAEDERAGVAVDVSRGGEFELTSSSFAPIQGTTGKYIRVRVNAAELPPENTTESVRVIFRERQCLGYTIRNIRLVPTLPLEDGTSAGTNNILLYFAQAPEDRREIPGPFRLAQIPVIFNPPAQRSPADAVLEVRDEEFVRPRLRAQ